MGERGRVLNSVGGAGEGLEGFEGHDPVGDAGAEAFGVEGALFLGEWEVSIASLRLDLCV